MKKRRNVGTRRSREEWESILERFEGSGKNLRDFCRAEGISAESIRRWRQRLKRSAAARFVELASPVPLGEAVTRWELDLELPGGGRLRLRS